MRHISDESIAEKIDQGNWAQTSFNWERDSPKLSFAPNSAIRQALSVILGALRLFVRLWKGFSREEQVTLFPTWFVFLQVENAFPQSKKIWADLQRNIKVESYVRNSIYFYELDFVMQQ